MAVMVKRLRPFNDVEELKAFYESNFGSYETIWLRSIKTGIHCMQCLHTMKLMSI